MELEILREAEHYWAVYKPAGLLCHRTDIAENTDDSLVDRLVSVTGDRVHLVHRLDRGTSGVMLVAKHAEAAALLGKDFASNQVKKEYLALCRGFVPPQIRIDYPLYQENFFGSKAERGRQQEAVSEVRCFQQAKVAFDWARSDHLRYSLVRVFPETGRTHQIRRHLAHVRHPIIGDARHGDGKQNKMAREITNTRRLMLLSLSITFYDPWTESQEKIIATPDQEWLEIEKQLGFVRN